MRAQNHEKKQGCGYESALFLEAGSGSRSASKSTITSFRSLKWSREVGSGIRILSEKSDSDPQPCEGHMDVQGWRKCFQPNWGIFERSHNTVGVKVFLTVFCLMIDPYLWLMDPDPGGPKTCGSGGSGSEFGSGTLLQAYGTWGVAEQGEGVQRVYEGEGIVSEDVVDVDVVRIVVVRTPAAALQRVQLVQREGVLHVVVISTQEFVRSLLLLWLSISVPGSGMEKNPNPGWKNSDSGSGINIPDLRHCFLFLASKVSAYGCTRILSYSSSWHRKCS